MPSPRRIVVALSEQVYSRGCFATVFASSLHFWLSQRQHVAGRAVVTAIPPAPVERPLSPTASPQLKEFVAAAIEQSKVTTGYNPSYVKIDYPNGDVSSDSGVCSDVSAAIIYLARWWRGNSARIFEHIGIVTNLSSETDKHYLIVHNIGAGARIEDVLLAWKIIGHYRYF